MSVADMLRLGTAGGLTAQTLADMALAEDRARRAAEKRGDGDAARIHDAEAAALCAESLRRA